MDFDDGQLVFKDTVSANVYEISCLTRHDDSSEGGDGKSGSVEHDRRSIVGPAPDASVNVDSRYHVYVRNAW